MSNTTRRSIEISVDQLRSYLQATHWYEDGNIRSVATIWHQHASEGAEVVLPFPYVKDYRQRLHDAIASLAFFEGRDASEVIGDISRLSSNVISVRVIHADTKDGTIPINDGVLLISKAKDLLLSAAMSVHSKKRQFIGSSPSDVREYMDSLLLGQTDVGSYIVNVLAPLPDGLAAPEVVGERTALSQVVTQNLIAGLEALTSASDQYEERQSLKVFDAAIQMGASANMCDALLGLSGTNGNRSFEIKVTAEIGPMFTGETKVFSFDAGHVEILSKASSYYKDDYVLMGRQLTGFVKKLSRSQGDNAGTVAIQCTIEEIERLVNVDLEGDDYHNAVLAHDRQSYVQCTGDVHVKSRSARLLNPHSFKVVDIGELF